MLDFVRIVEVSPRDGLQNLQQAVPLADRFNLIMNLVAAGVKEIEAGAFVSEKAVPQMAASGGLISQLPRPAGVRYTALTPNERGAKAALEAGAHELAVFTAASETFCEKNIGCSIEQSLQRFESVFDLADTANISVRAYISCVCGCPYEGAVEDTKSIEIALRLLEMGAREVCLADTIGAGSPHQTSRLVKSASEEIALERLALHMHDTYGRGLVNCYAGFEAGIRVFDSSVAGLGGCPFAPGAAGNLASEDLVLMFESMGVETGIDAVLLARAGMEICRQIGIPYRSRAGNALLNQSKG